MRNVSLLFFVICNKKRVVFYPGPDLCLAQRDHIGV